MSYTLFKEEVLKLTGVDLNAYKENQMKRRIDAMVKKCQCTDYSEYVHLIKKDKASYEEFVNYLTINVSEFFRNPSQWATLEKDVFPHLMRTKKQIRIWSAACSTGDEPYSLAMLLSRVVPLHQIHIIATDLDKEILAKAKEARYAKKYIENVPKDLQDKFFIQKDEQYFIKDELKKCITFKQHNLLEDAYPQNVDLIVCRNVMIYFTEEAKSTIYHKFHQALDPNGILFVGSTEQIIGAHKYGFSPYRAFFYQKNNTLD